MTVTPVFDFTQLTTAEVDWVQQGAGLTYAKGTILVSDGSGDLQALAVGTNTYTITADSAQAYGIKWSVVVGGGDVVGPGSAIDDAIVRFDSTTGKLIKNSVVTIADSTGNTAGVGTLNTHTIPGGTSTLAIFTDNLSVFAATTSLQLLGVISDETGTGKLTFATAPTFTTSIVVTGGATIDADGIDLVTGNDYEINGAAVLNATTLGTNVVASSLTSVGTLTSLTMGGAIVMGTNKITGLGDPTLLQDAVTLSFLESTIGFTFDYFFNNTSAGIV